MRNRRITSLRCPDCQERLLYDGKGLTCMVCPYTSYPPESDKSIPVPTRKPESEKAIPAAGSRKDEPEKRT